jgi:hypothetical protein
LSIGQNGGSCFILNGVSVLCSCTAEYTGDFCEIPVDSATTTTLAITTTPADKLIPCEPADNLCLNGGSCYTIDGIDILCLCQSGYSGNFCEFFS